MTGRRTRVLFIHHARTMGGATVSLGVLGEQIAAEGLEVRILLVDPTEEVRSYLKSKKLEVDEFRARVILDHTTASTNSLAYPIKFWRHITVILRARTEWARIRMHYQHWNPDIVHLNSVVLAPLVRPLNECGARVVWHIREAPTRAGCSLRTAWMRKQVRSLLNSAVFIGPQYRRAWADDHGGIIIYNTIARIFERAGALKVQKSAEEARESYGRGLAKRPIIFGFVGGVSEIKGTLPLLRAWKECRWLNGQATLLLAGIPQQHDLNAFSRIARHVLPLLGSGTYWQRCHRVWNSLSGNVELLPFTTDLTPFFQRIDVLLFPAIRDHFPRPVIEAAAFGVPAIGSELPSICDVIRNGESGLIVPVARSQSWIHAMRRVALEPKLLQQWGINAHKNYCEVFSTDIALRSLVKLYASMAHT